MAPRISTHVIAQEVAGEMILLDLDQGQYFGLDPVGARVWQLLEDGQPVDDILSAIHTEFDAPLDRIEADVRKFLDDLAQNGLMESPVQ